MRENGSRDYKAKFVKRQLRKSISLSTSQTDTEQQLDATSKLRTRAKWMLKGLIASIPAVALVRALNKHRIFSRRELRVSLAYEFCVVSSQAYAFAKLLVFAACQLSLVVSQQESRRATPDNNSRPGDIWRTIHGRAQEVLHFFAAPNFTSSELGMFACTALAMSILFNGHFYRKQLYPRLALCDSFVFATDLRASTAQSARAVRSQLAWLATDAKLLFASQMNLRCTLNSAPEFASRTHANEHRDATASNKSASRHALLKALAEFLAMLSAMNDDLADTKISAATFGRSKLWPLNRHSKYQLVLNAVIVKSSIATIWLAIVCAGAASFVFVKSGAVRVLLAHASRSLAVLVAQQASSGHNDELPPINWPEVASVCEYLFISCNATFISIGSLSLLSVCLIDLSFYVEKLGENFDKLSLLSKLGKNLFVRALHDASHSDARTTANSTDVGQQTVGGNSHGKSLASALQLTHQIEFELMSSHVQLTMLRQQLKQVLVSSSIVFKVQMYYAFFASFSVIVANKFSSADSIQSFLMPTVAFCALLNAILPSVLKFSRKCETQIVGKSASLFANITAFNELAASALLCVDASSKLHFEFATNKHSALNPHSMLHWRRLVLNIDLLRDSVCVRVFGVTLSGYSQLIEANIWVVSLTAMFLKRRFAIDS